MLIADACKRRAAFAVAAVLFVLGLVDLVLVWSLTSTGRPEAIANDPGKFVFHLLLLPCAYAILIGKLPADLVDPSPPSWKPLAIAFFTTALLAYFGWYAASDAQKGFCERLPQPADISNGEVRKETLRLREAFDKSLREARSDVTRMASIAASGPERIENYKKQLHRSGSDCHVLSEGTFRHKWSALLTFLGLSLIAALLAWLLWHVLIRRRLSHGEMETIVLVVGLAVVWFPLRAYSEWYINFAARESLDYEPFLNAAGALAVISILTFVLSVDRRVATATLLGVATFIPAALGVIEKIKPETLSALMTRAALLSPVAATGVYLCIATVICVLTYYLWDLDDA